MNDNYSQLVVQIDSRVPSTVPIHNFVQVDENEMSHSIIHPVVPSLISNHQQEPKQYVELNNLFHCLFFLNFMQNKQ